MLGGRHQSQHLAQASTQDAKLSSSSSIFIMNPLECLEVYGGEADE
jgi:CII-binding regulator of phage lambda lysogenization HflD